MLTVTGFEKLYMSEANEKILKVLSEPFDIAVEVYKSFFLFI